MKYRIVSNGHEYKVQKQKTTLFRGRIYWEDEEDVLYDIYTPKIFKTLDEARFYKNKLEIEDQRYFGDWKVIE